MRIDKWLWAARFFKTRSQASQACDLGRVQSGSLPSGPSLKPAREVHAGDRLYIATPGGEYAIEVLALSEARGGAPQAQLLYRESEESKQRRLQAAAERRAARDFEQLPAGRPSKHERRRIIQFRGRG